LSLKARTVDVSKKTGIFSSAQANMAVTTTVPEKPKSKLQVTKDLPPVGVSLFDTTRARYSDR